MAQIHYIKDLYENEDLSLREIARRTQHSFSTVQKYAYQEDWSEDTLPNVAPEDYPILGAYIPYINEWMEADRKVPRKQRHTARRIYDRLCTEKGYTGSYSSVKRYVRKKRFVMRTGQTGFLPIDHPAGWGQVDFGEFMYYDRDAAEQTGYALTISFPYSNKGFTQAFPSQNQECLLEGMKRIFEHIGGVPPRLRFDNMTTAVAQVLKDGERTLTDAFNRFMLHYRFQADFCNPASGNEKGNVENKVGYSRRNFFVPVPTITSFEEFKAKKAAISFIAEHKGMVIIAAVLVAFFLLVAIVLTSLASLVQGGGTSIIETTYVSSDADIYAAENYYCALEDALDAQINQIRLTHPGYDDYEYQIDAIEHDPYQLISYLQARFGAFTDGEEIRKAMSALFSSQYELKVSEGSEIRTRPELMTGSHLIIDPLTGEAHLEEYQYEMNVEYEHKTLYVALTNVGFEKVARRNMTDEQLIIYDALNRTFGNRDYLFEKYRTTGGSSGVDYTIPPEALSDVKFANMIREAEKYLGRAYMWGGKSPRTGFDCSGFVCWVINNCGNGWQIDTMPARYLYKACVHISPSEARPGDLIFFEKTYDVNGASHVAIYVGEDMMIHAGDPIKYSSFNTRYFKEHFLGFGRLPFYDD